MSTYCIHTPIVATKVNKTKSYSCHLEASVLDKQKISSAVIENKTHLSFPVRASWCFEVCAQDLHNT